MPHTAAVKVSENVMNQEQGIPGAIAFVATAFCATAFGIALDALLMQKGVSGLSVLYLSNILVGTAMGALVLGKRSREKAKQQVLKERVETVREVNQHLRNILTSLALYGAHTGGAHAEVLKEHLRRIEMSLAHMFAQLLFDPSLSQTVLRAVKDAADSTAF